MDNVEQQFNQINPDSIPGELIGKYNWAKANGPGAQSWFLKQLGGQGQGQQQKPQDPMKAKNDYQFLATNKNEILEIKNENYGLSIDEAKDNIQPLMVDGKKLDKRAKPDYTEYQNYLKEKGFDSRIEETGIETYYTIPNQEGGNETQIIEAVNVFVSKPNQEGEALFETFPIYKNVDEEYNQQTEKYKNFEKEQAKLEDAKKEQKLKETLAEREQLKKDREANPSLLDRWNTFQTKDRQQILDHREFLDKERQLMKDILDKSENKFTTSYRGKDFTIGKIDETSENKTYAVFQNEGSYLNELLIVQDKKIATGQYVDINKRAFTYKPSATISKAFKAQGLIE